MTAGDGSPSRVGAEVKWILDATHASEEQPTAERQQQLAGRTIRRTRSPLRIGIQPRDWRSRGSTDFLYEQGRILVDDAELDQVRRVLDEARIASDISNGLLGGVTLVEIDGEALDAVGVIDSKLGLGVASPNHVFGLTPQDSHCPATEPDEPGQAEPWPGPRDKDGGHGVRVAIVDTGFLQGWESRPQTSWLAGVAEYDIDNPDALEPRGLIDPYAGHGTFIAGVVRCMAPAAEVTVENAMHVAGVVDEANIVMQLGDALARSPDVINLSAGGYTRGNLPPKAFAALWEQRLRHHKGVVLVAAAGNNHTREPFWPAAFPWAVSVGALTADGRARADFSNFGGWVDVYAPGVDIVNAYAEGVYRLLLDPSVERTFDGMCRWSGTSFSTPIVAGLIAARMSRTGESGRQAADALLEAARGQFLPGVGPRLLP